MASGARIPLWALLTGWAGILAVVAPLAGRERSLPGIAALMLGGQIALHLLFSTGQWCAAAVTPAGGAAGGGRADRVMALAGRLVCAGGGRLRLTPGVAEHLLRQAGIDPSSAPPVPSPATAGMPGMQGMAGMPGMAGGHGGALATASGMHGPMGYSLPMLCCHLAAALAAGWLLRRGEAALWRVVRLSARGASRIASCLPLRAALAAVRALALTCAKVGALRHTRYPRRAEPGGGRPPSVTLRHSVVRRGPPQVALAA